VRQTLDKELAGFLRKSRGEASYSEYAKKLGMTASNLHRLENGQQTITLRKLQEIMERLKVDLGDIFSRRS
jgi:DNA-binding Xre family transcriptional regulator